MGTVLLRMTRLSTATASLCLFASCATPGTGTNPAHGDPVSAESYRGSPDLVLQELARNDARVATLELDVVVDAVLRDPTQGRSTHHCKIARDVNQLVSRCHVRKHTPFQYRPLGTPGYKTLDFEPGDGTQDLIFWQLKEARVYSDDRGADQVLDTQAVKVDQDNNNVNGSSFRALTQFSLEVQHNALPEVNQGLLALGRGYSSRLGQILDVVPEDGNLRVSASAHKGSNRWSLLVNPDEWLVLEAEMISAGGTVIYSILTAPDGASGRLRRGSGKWPVDATLTSYDDGVDQEWVEAVRREMSDPKPDRVRSSP